MKTFKVFGLPPDIVGAALGGLGVVQIAGLEESIPNNIALGVDSCLQACGIQRQNIQQPTDQREPRNAFNALPSGFPAPTSTIPQYTSTAYLVAPVEATAATYYSSSVARAASSAYSASYAASTPYYTVSA